MNPAAEIGLIEEEDIDLADAALALASLDHPGRDLAADAAAVNLLAERLLDRAAAASTARAQASALVRLLGEEEDFTGDTATYDDPANADLMRVLDRRRGLPIALCILYAGIARRLDWEADILDLPGHVLLRLRGRGGSLVIDPFARGRVTERQAIARLIGQADDRPLPPARSLPVLGNRAALLRMLGNQASRAENAGLTERALVLSERMTMVAPDLTTIWWERARLEQKLGHRRAARASLAAALETCRDAATRARINAALGALARSTH